MVRAPAEVVPRIPAPVRAVLRTAVWTYGTATSAWRPLPDFLIIGAQRAGTTALYEYLRRHPSIMGPSWKEIAFFDRHNGRGESWYRGQFPNRLRTRIAERRTGRSVMVGEASPSYLAHPHAAKRVAELVPNARLIVLLRDPVERAFSHYHHVVTLGREPLSFEEAIDREEARTAAEIERMRADPSYFSHAWWNFTYLSRGRYAEQLDPWLEAFPNGQLLVLQSEELFARPAATHARVLSFLGREAQTLRSYPRLNARPRPEMERRTRERLAEYYAGPNERLYELLGRDLGWTR
jgi:hypothetical protein